MLSLKRLIAASAACLVLTASALLLLSDPQPLASELLDHAKESRSAILGDGYIDSQWKKVWSRVPAGYKAVSQELSSYDPLSPGAKDKADLKADKELSSYSQVYTKKERLKVAKAEAEEAVKQAARRKAASTLYPWQWGEKQELADAKAHNKELRAYSNILGFPDHQKTKLHRKVGYSQVKPASPESELKSYEIIKGGHKMQKVKVTSPAKELRAYNILPDKHRVEEAKVLSPNQELSGYGFLPSGKGEVKEIKAENPIKELASYSNILSFSSPKSHKAQKAKKAEVKHPKAKVAEEPRVEAAKEPKTKEAKRQRAQKAKGPGAEEVKVESSAVRKTRKMVQNLLTLGQAEDQAKASSAKIQAELAPATAETQELAQQPLKTVYISSPRGAKAARGANGAEEGDRAECQRCLEAWTPESLGCVQARCSGLKGLSELDKAQLLLNNDIATKLEEVLGADVKAKTRKFILVHGFVAPQGLENEALPSWVSAQKEDGAIEGLGLSSGRTTTLHLGDRIILSGHVAHALDNQEVFDEVLKPLMGRQEVLNKARGHGAERSSGQGTNPHPVLLSWAASPPNPKTLQTPTSKHPAAKSRKAEYATSHSEGAKSAMGVKDATGARGGKGARGVKAAKSSRLSADPILRRLQLKARKLRRELKGPGIKKAKAQGTEGSEGSGVPGGARALSDVLNQKERELKRDEEMAQKADIKGPSSKHVNQGVGTVLQNELKADETRLRRIQNNVKMSASRRRLIEEQTKRANLEHKHAVLVATLEQLQKHLGKGPWSKYITLAKTPQPLDATRPLTPEHHEALQGAEELVQKAAKLAGGTSGLDESLGRISGLLQQASAHKDSKALGEQLQGLVSEAIDKVRKESGSKGPKSKAGVLRALLARDKARKSELLEAINRVRSKQAQLHDLHQIPTDLLQQEKLHKLEAAVVRDENVLDDQDYVPALHPKAPTLSEVRHGKYVRPKKVSSGQEGSKHALANALASGNIEGVQEEEQDAKMRKDVSALVDAAKVADPKQYDSLLKSAINHESNYLSSFQEAQSFADRTVNSDLGTADQVFSSTHRPVASKKADPVKSAMQAAQRDAREMHLHFKKEKEEVKQEKELEKEERRKEKKSKNYLPGIGFVEKGGAPSLVDELWRHHRIPVADAEKETLPRQNVLPKRLPKLNSDGLLRSSEKHKGVNTKEPSAWKLAQKDAHSAVQDSEQVGGGIGKALDSLLGGLTRDSVKRPVGKQSIQGNSVWNYI